ncbi:Uncharacterized membrane-anchored protein YitT, contains DUF161 and DUF2179 domains [Flavobacteriaceae bacterium MAR_2010_188]|nr:Uncharacterized membrane-anchored protein YitT, contains DUF161 and DUF2179 domains [Flavobacteriaceae bacterium MAR_2010_188]
MNPFLTNIVIKSILNYKKENKVDKEEYSDYILAKNYRELRITVKRSIRDFILIGAGIFSAAFGFKGFLLTNQFIDGGATGISLLIAALTDIPLGYLLLIVNAPFVVLGYNIIDRKFAIKTALAITGLALCVALVEFPNVTDDKLLVAVFGGFFLGAGIGMSIRGGAVIDGTEVLAIYLSKKFSATIGDIIILINVMIFSIAAYLLSVEIALYSMITYIAASKTLDFIIEGIEEYVAVTIIAIHSTEIKEMIIHKLGRGVTIYNGKRGFRKEYEQRDLDILYTVITRLELNKLYTEIEKIESSAFIVTNSVKDIKGGVIKKRRLKH